MLLSLGIAMLVVLSVVGLYAYLVIQHSKKQEGIVDRTVEYLTPKPKKYYVHSGTVNWVGIADSPVFAAMKAVDGCTQGTLEPTIFVDLRGYRDGHKACWHLDTDELISNMNGER